MSPPTLITAETTSALDTPPRLFAVDGARHGAVATLLVDLRALIRLLLPLFCASPPTGVPPGEAWRAALQRFVHLLRACGLDPVFVLSGPAPLPPALPGAPPAAATPPVTSDDFARFSAQAKANELFMRVAPVTRATPSFQAENRVSPPLAPRAEPDAVAAAIVALQDLNPNVQVVHSQEPGPEQLVELAQTHSSARPTLVMSDDDTILVRAVPRGGVSYAPLSSLAAQPVPAMPAGEALPTRDDQDDGFAFVPRRRKGRKAQQTNPSLPKSPQPEESIPFTLALFQGNLLQIPGTAPFPSESELRPLQSISLSITTPETLSTSFNLSGRLLPMLAAFATFSAPTPGTQRKPGQPPPPQIEYSRLLERALPITATRLGSLAALIREEWTRATSMPPTFAATPSPLRSAPSRLGLGRGSRPPHLSASGSVPSSGAATPRAAPESAAGSGASTILEATSSALDPVQRCVAAVLTRLLLLKETNRTGTVVRGTLSTALADVRDRLAPVLHDRVASYAVGHGVAATDSVFFHPEENMNDLSVADAELVAEKESASSSDPVVEHAAWWTAVPDMSALVTWRGEYDQGVFPLGLATSLVRRTVLIPPAPENPDWPSIDTAGSAPALLRTWAYGVLFDAYGMRWSRRPLSAKENAALEAERKAHDLTLAIDAASAAENQEHEEGGTRFRWIQGVRYRPDEDPDELVSVGTPSSYTASHRGSLASLGSGSGSDRGSGSDSDSDSGSDDADDQLATSLTSLPALPGQQEENRAAEPKPDPIVREWVVDDNRIVQQRVAIPSLANMLSVAWGETAPDWAPDLLTSPSSPVNILQQGAPTRAAVAQAAVEIQPSLRACLSTDSLPQGLIMALAAVRLTVVRDAERMEATASISRRAWWTEAQVRAAVFAVIYAFAVTEPEAEWAQAAQVRARRVAKAYADLGTDRPLPVPGTMHRAHAISAALASLTWVAAALALEDEASALVRAQGGYDPALFQMDILGAPTAASHAVEKRLVKAVLDGLETHLAPEGPNFRPARARLAKPSGKAREAATGRNLFASLGAE